MPSAYVLARDNLEQARAILSSEVWFDGEAMHLLDLAIARLNELNEQLVDDLPPPRPPAGPAARRARLLAMPWLDPGGV